MGASPECCARAGDKGGRSHSEKRWRSRHVVAGGSNPRDQRVTDEAVADSKGCAGTEGYGLRALKRSSHFHVLPTEIVRAVNNGFVSLFSNTHSP
jgi:LDH2 family malate/lactate/ureidoglycolate dehydrogenase